MNKFYKNKISLLLFALSLITNYVVCASNLDKIVIKSAVIAFKGAQDYCHEDFHNQTIMNAPYFDNRPFQDNNEKQNFIDRLFKQADVQTDMNERAIKLLSSSSYSRHQLTKFMQVAQKLADQQGRKVVNLVDLEQAHIFNQQGYASKYVHDCNRQVAHHEAGHALMGVLQNTGVDVLWASLQTTDTSQGRVTHFEKKSLTDQEQFNVIKMKLAGGIAEQIWGQVEFENYSAMLLDFLQRKSTRKDWCEAKESAWELAGKVTEKNKINCLLSMSQKFDQDLTYGQHFFKVYAGCTEDGVIKGYQRGIIQSAYYAARKTLTEHELILNKIAQELIEHKVVSGKRIKQFVQDGKISPS